MYAIKKEKKESLNKTEKIGNAGTEQFMLGCLFMAFLTGLLIPSAVIRSSPLEFVVIAQYHSPLLYVISAFLLAAGTFIVWVGLFYYLADNRIKEFMSVLIWIISVIAVINYMFFGTRLGNLSALLQYDTGIGFSAGEMIINAEIIIFVSAALLVLWIKKVKKLH